MRSPVRLFPAVPDTRHTAADNYQRVGTRHTAEDSFQRVAEGNPNPAVADWSTNSPCWTFLLELFARVRFSQDGGRLDVEPGERRKRQVANYEPHRDQHQCDDGGPTMVLPTIDPATNEAAIRPRPKGPQQEHHCHEPERVVPQRAVDVSVQKRVQHAQAATAGTVDSEQRVGGAHRKWPTRRRRISYPNGAARQSGREGHTEWGAELGKDPRLSRVLHRLSSYEYEENALAPITT
jgi:hypothetical protein